MTIQKKNVRWSTVTVYEFGVGIGGSAIPKRGGPSIGLARKPNHVWSSSLDDVCGSVIDDENDNSNSNNIAAVAIATQHRQPGGTYNNNDSCVVHKPQRLPRRRKVRWLKPLERVTMLTNAGCSEKRIYRMLMECSEIAMSRRLSLCVDRLDSSGSKGSQGSRRSKSSKSSDDVLV